MKLVRKPPYVSVPALLAIALAANVFIPAGSAAMHIILAIAMYITLAARRAVYSKFMVRSSTGR